MVRVCACVDWVQQQRGLAGFRIIYGRACGSVKLCACFVRYCLIYNVYFCVRECARDAATWLAGG